MQLSVKLMPLELISVFIFIRKIFFFWSDLQKCEKELIDDYPNVSFLIWVMLWLVRKKNFSFLILKGDLDRVNIIYL